MNTYSMTIAGLIAAAVITLAKSHHIELPYTSDQVTQTVFTALQMIGFVIAYIGRYRHGDITWYGAKINADRTPVEIQPLPNDPSQLPQ